MTTTRLLLVGDAGSGKTTTLHVGALVLAHDYQQRQMSGAHDLLDLHTARPLLPFYIRLTLVATYVRKLYDQADAHAEPRLAEAPSSILLDWLDGYVQEQVGSTHPDMPADLPSRRIADTTGTCLLLLDGLDETGDRDLRDYMQRLIGNLVQDFPWNRYLVASRPFDDLHLAGFTERHLSPMNGEEMQTLLRNWFSAVYADPEAARHAQQSVADQVAYVWGILEHNARLFEMATNPLLLTSMALLVQTTVGLPRERAELYNRLVFLLIEAWRIHQKTGGLPLREADRPKLYGEAESVASVQQRLQLLAAWMQTQERREIYLAEAQDALRPVYAPTGWSPIDCDRYIETVLDSLALESGLVQRRDYAYSFTHYTVQEYLTARHYDQRDTAVDDLLAHQAEPRWREVILLAVGHWVTVGMRSRALRFLQALLDQDDHRAVLLAGAALDDADASRVLELADVRRTTCARLAAIAFDPPHCHDPHIRNEAAELLDRLDADQRTALDLAHADYWARDIDPGSFMMGDDTSKDNDEKPAFICTIHHRYALARYPVTNRQYDRFLTYLEEQGRNEEARQRRPRGWPGRHYRAGEGNHPVVQINWEDASAFAQWASDTFLSDEQRARGEAIRLPTEPEWERAAAYPLVMPSGDPVAGRRDYPWGDWHDVTHTSDGSIKDTIPANTSESGIGGTSVVGIFPHGAAACGAEELAGTVWEWCSTAYQAYPLPADLPPETLDTSKRSRTYVLRGGSWAYTQSHARCGARYNYLPVLDNIGVRLARLFSS